MSQSKRPSAALGQVREAAHPRGSATTDEGIAGERAALAARGRARDTVRVTRAAQRLQRASRADARAE
jgi:hypothetical protein